MSHTGAGLAIYNSHILEFQFPPVLYKKLMGGTVLVGSGAPGVIGDSTAAAVAAAINLGPSLGINSLDRGASHSAVTGGAGLGAAGAVAGGGCGGHGGGSTLGGSWAGVAPHHLGEGGGVLGLEVRRSGCAASQLRCLLPVL